VPAPASLTPVPGTAPRAEPRARAVHDLHRATGQLSTAAMARMDDEMPWFAELSAEDRSWVGVIVQAGIKSFVDWYADEARHPELDGTAVAAQVFGAAPRALAGVISLQQTVDLGRLGIEVVESNLDAVLNPEDARDVHAGVLRYGPYAMVALLPLFAVLQKLSYLRKNPRYPQRPSGYAEHLIFGAHLHAFAFLMLIPFVVTRSAIVEVALAAWILVYVGRARKKVYGGTWWSGFLRSLPAGLVYLVLLVLTMTALVVISIAL